MRRRAFLAGFGATATVPWTSRAQQSALPLIGFVRSSSIDDSSALVAAFELGLRETGHIDGQNVLIELRPADDNAASLPSIIEDLLRRRVSLIFGNAAAIRAAKALTSTVPIVFASGSDPARDNLVATFNQPEANITGISFFNSQLGPKKLELIRDLVRRPGAIGVLVNPHSTGSRTEGEDIAAAARATGQDVMILETARDTDFAPAFDTLVDKRAVAAIVTGDAIFLSRRSTLRSLARQHRIPIICSDRLIVEATGVLSYGASITEAYRAAGIYAGRILRGEQPRDLPVMRSSKFELVVNLKFATELGLTVPDTMLARADTVIE
jgi:putative tryptophan/tyrosine transport system substrate-binding protein